MRGKVKGTIRSTRAGSVPSSSDSSSAGRPAPKRAKYSDWYPLEVLERKLDMLEFLGPSMEVSVQEQVDAIKSALSLLQALQYVVEQHIGDFQ
jgi:hypothetical protein